MISKAYRLARDNVIVHYLNAMQLSTMASAYNWLTTETIDVVIMSLTAKFGITGIQTKYLVIIIMAFII